MNKMSSFILTGFCALLFGGGMSAPAHVNPSLSRLLLLIRSRTTADALAIDRNKLSLDLGEGSGCFSG
jgi:hypothetical protein